MPRVSSILVCCVALAGCHGAKSVVTGTVTYEGAPIGRGQITFTPADGKGKEAGGPIAAGKYSVEDVVPGKNIVQIVGVKAIQFVTSHEEMARAAPAGRQPADSADDVPAAAEGNGQTVEITAGRQERNFDLKRPVSPR